MEASGWSDHLRRLTGLELDPDASTLDTHLFQTLDTAAFPGFAGVRAIQPGDPAMSLVYHVLATGGLTMAAADRDEVYPTLDQIDRLENYIYARQRLPESLDDYVLATFAYQYRPSYKTPHRHHADLVFSRTGVARVGTLPPVYVPSARAHAAVTAPEAAGQDLPVTPARYALFLARRVRGHEPRIGKEAGDWRRDFLIPERKIFEGCSSLAGSALWFEQSHRDEKLQRMVDNAQMRLPAGRFDVRRAPFLRQSESSTITVTNKSEDLVALQSSGSSVLLVPCDAALVRPAEQDGHRVRIMVPPFDHVLSKELSNRRYTSLKLLKERLREAVDFFFSDVLFRGGRRTTGFRSPRNAPVFVNIRYEMEEQGNKPAVHIGADRQDLERTVRNGCYWAGLFLDGLCDGCVVGRVEPGAGIRSLPVLPAFSLVAAPDLFPKLDPLDLNDLDSMFLEGGTEAASGGRLPANPNITLPKTAVQAFPSQPQHPIEEAVSDTITAVVSAAPGERRVSSSSLSWPGPNTLPDTSSNVFAPGWDLTFSRDSAKEGTYFSTLGLGSPFAEDMKLCAAANGMWPGVSPDASRTFFPSLAGVVTVRGSKRPPTATPLLDEELGFHPLAPAVADHGQQACRGWDGEHGPFLVVREPTRSGRRIAIDFADVNRVDYVENVLQQRFDFTRLRMIDSGEMIRRMAALRRCITALPGSAPSQFTGLWLVSAEAVPHWRAGARALGIPAALFGDVTWAQGHEQLDGSGWLMVFADPADLDRKAPANGVRRVVDCKWLYVCQVDAVSVRWTAIDSAAPIVPDHKDWRWYRPA